MAIVSSWSTAQIVTTRRLLVLPACPKGSPATTTTVSPGTAKPVPLARAAASPTISA